MGEPAHETALPREPKELDHQASNPSVGASDFEIPEVNRSRMPPGPAKYLDEGLPPMDSLEAIFQDLVAKALSLGFADVLRRLGDRPLRVATVCSGTESPLLALEMIMQGLRTTQWRFRIKHVFSCEIVAFKQAYIERNFKPPILFRDLLELVGDEARTAYGSSAPIPGNLDILIAGTACVDFSLLNGKRKTLDDFGESGSTFFALLKHAEKYRPRMIILENVRVAPWDQLVDIWSKVGYHATFFALDTKKYYIPQTRQRGYMVCIDRRWLGNLENEAGGESLSNQLGELVSQFARQASSPAGKFLLGEDDIQLEQIERDLSVRLEASSLRSRNSWERYQVRHLVHRRTHELGAQRPISMSQPGGVVCQPPDFFPRQWFKAQVERIWDTLDIKYLIDLTKGVDMIAKERFVDLSQGVDRGNEGEKNFGVAGCLTPCGIPFVTSRGRPISGLESIILQGLPKDRMMLTRESPRELQDLAGNAMTSTVVCAVMLSALIACHGMLEERAEPTEAQADVEERKSCALEEDDHHLSTITIEDASGQSIDQDALRRSAYRSARYCACEKQTGAKENLLQCVQCGHTACRSCAGNPAHLYKPLAICRKQPLDFVAELKGILPMRFTFDGLSEQAFEEFGCKFPGDSEAGPSVEHVKYIDVVGAVFTDEVRFFDIVRTERWTVVYEGEHCSLHLSITHDACQWFVFGKPPRTSPARCLLREILAKPIARMTTTSQSLLDGQWEICAPLSSALWLDIAGRGEQVQAHQARCGLMQAEPANSKVWSQIQITVEDVDARLLGVDVHGAYEHLPECGTALGSLYRKPATESSPAVSLFFDPSRYRESQHDSCVLALEHGRISGYAPRMTIAELSPCWRALHVKKESSRVRAFARAWQKVSGAALRPKVAENVIYRSLPTLTSVSVGDRNCHQSLINLVSIKAPVSTLNLSGAPMPWQARGLRSTELKGLAWVVQKVAAVAGFRTWRPIEVVGSLACATCQPESPKILWGVNKKNSPIPYEDPKGAAAYERAVKSKPPPFQVFERIGEDGYGELRFVLNIQVLAHSTFSRLVDLGTSEDVRLSWRLIPNVYDAGREQPGRITMRGNKDDPPSTPPPNFRLTLRQEQLRSLTWMIEQEREDIEPFVEQETEEAALPMMSWRAEVRAEMPRTIRGGVLADEVGYGKTAIVLGLIDARLEQDRAIFKAQEEDPKFIASRATLIVVPGNVFLQWASEIEKFLGRSKYKVVKIKDTSSMAKTTVEMIQEADIVLVAWGLFKSNVYFQAMRHFTGTPRVPTSGDRNFDSWFTDSERSLRQLVPVLKDEGPDAFLQEVLRRRHELKETQAQFIYAPSKRLRGEAFERAQQEKNASQGASTVSGDQDEGVEVQTTADLESHIHEESESGTSVIETDEEPVEQQTGKRKRGSQAAQPKKATSGKSKEKKRKQPWNHRQKLNIQKDANSDMKNVKHPPLHAFRFNRLVIDEFMHMDEPKPIALATLAARSKWILSGTPALKEFADIKTMAGFLGTHLGIDDDCDAPTRNQRLKSIRRNLTAVEAFQMFQPPRSSAWYTERRNVAQRFVQRFVRQNSPNIDFIPLTNHVVLARQFPAERQTYERLYAYLQKQHGSAHRIRNPYDDPLISRLNRFLGDQSECAPQIALVKSAVTADVRDLAWSVEDCETKLETHNKLLTERWNRLTSLAKEVVHAWQHWSVDASLWVAFLGDVFAHDFGDLDATDEGKVRLESVFGSYEAWHGTDEETQIEVQVAERFRKAKADKTAQGPAKRKAAKTKAAAAKKDDELEDMDQAESPNDDLGEISDADSAVVAAAVEAEEVIENEKRLEKEENPDNEHPETQAASEDESNAKPPQKKAKTTGKTAKAKKAADETEKPDKPAGLSALLAKEKKEANRQAKEKPVRKKMLAEVVAGVRKAVQAFRDVRFFTTMKSIQTVQEHHCQGCHEIYDDITSVNVVRSCGHLLCVHCIEASQIEAASKDSVPDPSSETDLSSIEKRTCRVPGCHGSVETSMLVAGSSLVDTNIASESAKLAAMINVIQQTADDELVLLFVQFMDLISVASQALKSAKIEHRIAKTGRDSAIIDEFISPPTSQQDDSGDGPSAPKPKGRSTAKGKTTKTTTTTKRATTSKAKATSKFKAKAQEQCMPEAEDEEMPDVPHADTPQGPRPKVLILPVGTSMAAGLNLQAVNHVIFLSPLVLPEQSEWDSGMIQAIGRVRRYGQERTVHVWHLLSDDTADITILKEREEGRINEATRCTLVMRVGRPMMVELNGVSEEDSPLEGPSLAFAQGVEFEEDVQEDVEETPVDE